MKRILCSLAILSILGASAFAQSTSREEILKALETKRAELRDLEAKFLAPTDEDLAAYAEFLSHPDTGLIRLLPREAYDDGKTLTLRGGGAYYSFSRRTHEYGRGSDISLEQKYVSVGFAGADYGLMTSLGDVPLESVNADNQKVMIAAQHKVPGELPQARVEQRRFGAGTIVDGVSFKERLPATVNSTYVLRSINYDSTDVLVAFRIVRRDFDGSMIIAWKLLTKYPKPELARTTGDQ
jgi:hypothetical protein